jgi:hypothetical protein
MTGGGGRLRDVAVLGLAELVDRNVADRLAETNGAGPLQRPFHLSLGSSVRRGET